MLKRLRLKFVCINMVIITAMLCVIFGLVIHFTDGALEKESLQMMQTIVDSPLQMGRPGTPSEQVNLPYFMVTINSWGELTAVNGGYFDVSDKDMILTVAQAALAQEEQSGVLEEYNLRFLKATTLFEQRIVFADTTSEDATMKSLIQTCIFIAVLSFLIFWGLSLLLARWAVGPVDEAWQQQRQFVADASHELKTPLTVIMTNAELLQSPEYSDEERLGFTDSILTMAHQMRGLVESLLELARVDNGAVKTAFTELTLTDLVGDGLLPFEPLYFEKGLTLNAQLEEGVRVKGSPTHLAQVVEILLDNAMKYSDPQGVIWVTLRKQSSHVILAVANPGPPIEGKDLQNIFKRFYRADKSRSRDGSYGLGLSIAERVVTEHRGKIWAESRDGINYFFVQLPTI